MLYFQKGKDICFQQNFFLILKTFFMKNLNASFLILLALVFLLAACQKEKLIPDLEQIKPKVDTDTPEVRLGSGDFAAIDLEITDYKTDIVNYTVDCGLSSLPNTSCQGGQRSFTSTIEIRNTGRDYLVAGDIIVLWRGLNERERFDWYEQISHSGIPAGHAITRTRDYNLAACSCTDGLGFFTHGFDAIVDPNNDIIEILENNNNSMIYNTCDNDCPF